MNQISIVADEINVDIKLESDDLSNDSIAEVNMDDYMSNADDIEDDENDSATDTEWKPEIKKPPKTYVNKKKSDSKASADAIEKEDGSDTDWVPRTTEPPKKPDDNYLLSTTANTDDTDVDANNSDTEPKPQKKQKKKPVKKPVKKMIFECTICLKQFKMGAALHNHLYKLHFDKLDCLHCDISFKSYIELQEHILTHRKEITLDTVEEAPMDNKEEPDEIVEPANVASTSQANTQPQTMDCDDVHTDKCEFCDDEMANHTAAELSKTGGVQYECCQCKKYIFPRLTKLKVHIRCHQKNALCTICGATFDGNYKLIKHTRIHTGEKVPPLEYHCEFCDKKFLYKMGLTRHLAEHTGIRPFECDQCDRNYAVNFDLKKHKSERHPKEPKRPKW